MTSRKIVNGPNKWQLILALFEPDQSTAVNFSFEDGSGRDDYVTVDSAKRLDDEGDEWILICWVPFSQGHFMKLRYSCKTRRGEHLETWQSIEKLQDIDEDLDRAERDMTHHGRIKH